MGLVAPDGPALAHAPPEQLQIRPPAARLDDVVLLVGLAGVFALAGGHQVDLPPPRRQRARVLAARAEQHDLGHVAEIEPHAAPVRPAVLADLVPDDVGLVLKPPRRQHPQPVGQQRIRDPEIAMRPRLQIIGHRQRADVVERQRVVAAEPPMLRRDLAGAVGEAPGRIGHHGRESPPGEKFDQILRSAVFHPHHLGEPSVRGQPALPRFGMNNDRTRGACHVF